MEELALMTNLAMTAELEMYSPYTLKGIEITLKENNILEEDAQAFWSSGCGTLGQRLYLERCLAKSF